ncbi:hypothetical protein ACRALDRAFT_2016279 [Sodiomyces alcalophilus JCM 7366]|uniref:uncharacterized protein n=1 Tax=Sodiomyces alcalophilus JCM 7366 TaxID=591952 RepID=UPI0039B601CF
MLAAGDTRPLAPPVPRYFHIDDTDDTIDPTIRSIDRTKGSIGGWRQLLELALGSLLGQN